MNTQDMCRSIDKGWTVHQNLIFAGRAIAGSRELHDVAVQIKKLDPDAFDADGNLTEGADEIFVNGDSFIPNARALEHVFKARMFASLET